MCERHCGFTLLNLCLWISCFAIAVVRSVCSLFNDLVSNADCIVKICWLIVLLSYKEYEMKLLWHYIWLEEYRKATKNLVERSRYPVLQSNRSPVE